jgi:hypothetical protein
MTGILLNGGAYFVDTRIKFFDHEFHNSSLFSMNDIHYEDVLKARKANIPSVDWVFVFGLKTLTRRLKKARIKPAKIKACLQEFFVKSIPAKMPIGVLDDFNGGDETLYGDFIRSLFLENFNCKVFLLREYLRDKTYDKRVHPFSIPCVDFSHLTQLASDKKLDIYFKGNNSSGDRKPITQQVKRLPFVSTINLYEDGEQSPEKVSFETYLSEMAQSKFCLHFQGAGFCCFRYQEIASVGSIIVSPDYPFIVRNDYKDMISCVKYNSAPELSSKLSELLRSASRINEMQAASLLNFKENHSNVQRYKTFLNYLDDLK